MEYYIAGEAMEKLKRILSLFTIYLFLNMAFLPSVIAQENGVAPPAPVTTGETLAPDTVADEFERLSEEIDELADDGTDAIVRPETTCSTSKLTPEEVQKILDDIRKQGISGQQIGSDDTKAEDKLLKNQVILTDEKGEHAAQAEIPDQKFKPEQASWLLNNTLKGASHFGVVLDDTLRTGRCTDAVREDDECYLDYPRTVLRNSGTGVVADTVTAWDAVTQLFEGEEDFGLTPEQQEAVKERAGDPLLSGNVALEATVAKRVPSDDIKNIWEAQDFKVKAEMNASNPEAVISVYSLFDRYFNAAFSTEMVLSIVGPMLLHRAGKMFGYIKNRAKAFWPFDIDKSKYWQKFNAYTHSPSTILGQRRLAKMRARAMRYPDIKKVHDDLILGKGGDSGYAMIKGGGFELWMEKAMANDGIIGSIKDPKVRQELYTMIDELHGYTKTMKNVWEVSKTKYDDAVKAAQNSGLTGEALEAVTNDAKVEHARTLAKIMQDADDTIDLDLPEYFMRKRDFGFPGKGVYNTEQSSFQNLYDDSSVWDNQLFKPYIEHGEWNPNTTGYLTGPGGSIKLFEVQPGGKKIGDIVRDDLDLELAAGRWDKTVVKLRDGTYVPFTHNHKQTILEHTTGPLQLYKEGWAEATTIDPRTGQQVQDFLTPTRFADALSEKYASGRMFNSAQWNMKKLKHTLQENNYVSRKYTSLLDKLYAQESELVYKYLANPLTTGAKLTFAPVVYWHAKKGFGFEEFSFYQLPEEWKKIEIYPREPELYDDAYIDFFGGNKGSDEGDLFSRVIQYLPWKMVLNKVSEQFEPVKNSYDKWTGVARRSEVYNLVFYSYGPKDCSGCTLTMNSPDDFAFINLAAFSPESTTSFLLEEPIKRANKESEGTLLVAFAHHTDMKGDSGEAGVEGEPINLQEAINDKTTCREKVKELAFGMDIGPAAGPILAAGENVAYFFFGWPGVFGSAFAQLYLLSDLKDCVDAEEGYYLHLWTPPTFEEQVESAQDKATAEGAALLQKGKDEIDPILKGTGSSFMADKWEQLGDGIDKFTKNASRNDIVQANLSSTGPVSGKLTAPFIFYLWLEPGFEMSKSRYVTEGQTQLKGKDVDGKETLIELNNETGQLTLNGKPIIASESGKDHVRLAAINGAMPAMEIPQVLGHVGLKGDEDLFEININGQAKVIDSAVLDCIKQAVKEQTGLELASDNLTQAFGLVEVVVTDTHPQIKMDLAQKKVLAEGSPRKVFTGEDAKINIYGNANVDISQAQEVLQAGKLESIQFQNGSIIYNPKNKELIVWLKHHEEGKISGGDVKDFKAELSSFKNPETDCEEYAVDFKVTGDPKSDLSMYKNEQFTKSLEHMGPFQVFDTDEQTFLFYSEMTETGECVNRFRIIDKTTGEVYDQAINRIEQTPEGLKIFTDDGQSHDLGFSYENGKPVLTYNGVPNTLNYAQGRDGSFWYDPEKGLWFAENGMLLPLLEAFKNQGLEFKGQPDGTAAAAPGASFMVLDQGATGPGFLANLPSLPENPLYLFLFIISALGMMLIVQRQARRKKRVIS